MANSGETLELRAADGALIQTIKFNDKVPWPTTADGGGYSLVLANLDPGVDASDASNWSASASIGGSPGAADDIVPGTDLVAITGIARLPDGGVELLIEAGQSVGIEYSTDLFNWEPIGTANGLFEDHDALRNATSIGSYRTVED